MMVPGVALWICSRDLPRSDPPLGPSLPLAADATLGAADDARLGTFEHGCRTEVYYGFTMGVSWA